MSDYASNYFKKLVLKQERNTFLFKLIVYVILYVIFTFWLNSIRTTAAIWFVWVLIIIQFTFYFSIFIVSFRYSKIYGLNSNFGSILFIILAVLGRINDWELLIIPLLLIVMTVCAFKNKNISDRAVSMLPNNSD